MRTVLLSIAVIFAALAGRAQMFTGMEGLINTPSAEMQPAGEAMIGGYYMNSHFLPGDRNWKQSVFKYDGKSFNTCDFYLSVTPFEWIEIGYAFTLLKTLAEGRDKPAYNQKDRYFSLKLRPLKEGKWWPAIAVGSTDIMASFSRLRRDDRASGYFCTHYIAATKHFDIKGDEIGVNLAYRHSGNRYTRQWQGAVGGLTWRPRWARDLRTIVEWTGREVNFGADYLLWRHLYMQAAMVSCKYLSGGVSYRVNLF